ncbi:shikimate kinase [Staphylococcus marylandisciuri]
MGVGKTTFGQYIADLNNLSFVDLDEYIVKNESQSIPTIFNDYGESYFRSLEAKYLHECLTKFNVIATGGGIIEGDESYELLRKQKFVIWLDCHIEIIYNRIKEDKNRPNANKKSLTDLKNLYFNRYSRYNEIAFIKVNSNQPLKDLYSAIFRD